jgi:uncharacterized protein
MVVLITGASAGIGKELAMQLSQRDARLALSARRLDRLEDLNRSLGGGHLCIRVDVSQTDDCRMFIERAHAELGRIDTLVCNAGYGIYRRADITLPSEMRAIIATNILGTTDCIHFASPLMLKQPQRDGVRGQMMLVSSAAARRSPPYMGAYSATKAAQLSIAEALRVELRPHRIAVTSVHPIMTTTEFGQVAEQKGDIRLLRTGRAQTVQHVVQRMVKAIERPSMELWPSRPSRYLLLLAALAPRLADGLLARFRDDVERASAAAAEPR